MTQEPVTIVLPGDPTGTGRPRMTLNGHVYTPAKTRNKMVELRMTATQTVNGAPPIEGAVRLEILAEFQIPRSASKKRQALMLGTPATKRPDFDNLAKLCADALNQVVYRDDAQVAEARIRKVWGNDPKIVISVISLT